MASEITYEQEGETFRASGTYQRGRKANTFPREKTLRGPQAISRYFMKGLAPDRPPFMNATPIVAFGSCFAAHIIKHLRKIGYAVAEKRDAPVTRMGDGIVNTFALRQQFEWAWEAWRPSPGLWRGHDLEALGCGETERLATRAIFDKAGAFIITLGLSEIWYDQPTGEVFWRTVPADDFDPDRHKFRLATFQENLENLEAIYRLIRGHRPNATLVFTLSPIPLAATFRPISAPAANSASKAILRAALDQFTTQHSDIYYFPSYEIATNGFANPFMEDRMHVHKHVLDLNMTVFERYFCSTNLSDEDVAAAYEQALRLDRQVATEGHFSVPRIHDTGTFKSGDEA